MPHYLKIAGADGIATLAIHHPPANVLSRAAFQEIGEAMEGFAKDPAVRVVIVTGEGANFAAGADVREIAAIEDAAAGEAIALQAHQLALSIERSGLPVIAAINGYCLGGGCELALACTIRIAADTARLGQPEIKIGIMPGMGGTQRLPRLVGVPKALELLLTGEAISAPEAYRIGLVNLVVPEAELRRQAMGMARRMAAMSRVAVSKILHAVLEGVDKPFAEAVQMEARLFGDMMPTADKKEGVAAFLEKRPPRFTDR
ncbi:MAG: enoyl-CoA hydratase/isomerase family protein [Planctomycetes bacterium]|nr:enoyl-CoA hydratase/isomerase family protein [Planctomycetota bacterium]